MTTGEHSGGNLATGRATVGALAKGGNHCLASSALLMHSQSMSDKEFALAAIQRLPADVGLDTIAERLEFLAAIRKGCEQIDQDEIVPHEEVKRQLATWLSK